MLPCRAADNSLSYLPEGLGGLTSLQSLRASNNTLLELPDSLVDLLALTTLDLRWGRHGALNVWICCCSVRVMKETCMVESDLAGKPAALQGLKRAAACAPGN